MTANERLIRNTIKYRKLKKITQEELAIKINKTCKFIENFEANKNENAITITLLSEIANALDVEIVDLLKDWNESK